ncbi:hypothetical protein [Desulfogranum mediterraneum]|uniref:hypothetical protein n=1 Tax=Desulfogranum mediterraneum TaxID=160661 RepID=UPI0003FF11B3|nr:hypothetical protein [Desulfogranum mediterraneum]
MQFKVIIRRAMFIFGGIVNGKAQLQSVRFLSDTMMQEQNTVLLVKEQGSVDFFLSGSVPVARVSADQFTCLAAAARFFGHLPGSRCSLPIWFGADTLEMEPPAAVGEAELICS